MSPQIEAPAGRRGATCEGGRAATASAGAHLLEPYHNKGVGSMDIRGLLLVAVLCLVMFTIPAWAMASPTKEVDRGRRLFLLGGEHQHLQ